MALKLLHSGSFTDYEGNTISVQLYRHRDLNASPTSMSFSADGGTLRLSIWSYDGEAILYDIQDNWLNYKSAGSEQLPGSQCHKYYYDIICDPNSGAKRTGSLKVGLETIIDGDYTFRPTITIPVTQSRQI